MNVGNIDVGSAVSGLDSTFGEVGFTKFAIVGGDNNKELTTELGSLLQNVNIKDLADVAKTVSQGRTH